MDDVVAWCAWCARCVLRAGARGGGALVGEVRGWREGTERGRAVVRISY
jgi:hypothetical protein